MSIINCCLVVAVTFDMQLGTKLLPIAAGSCPLEEYLKL